MESLVSKVVFIILSYSATETSHSRLLIPRFELMQSVTQSIALMSITACLGCGNYRLCLFTIPQQDSQRQSIAR